MNVSSLKQYKESRLERLSGSFDIYVNNQGKFLHISKNANIKIDLNFWKFIETVTK
jgi:hypothetical protein